MCQFVRGADSRKIGILGCEFCKQVSPSDQKRLLRSFVVRTSTQRISAECQHSKPCSLGPFEKAINVDVAGMGSLQNALASLGKKTLITGQNRIVCEECTHSQVRTTIRMPITGWRGTVLMKRPRRGGCPKFNAFALFPPRYISVVRLV